jgi:hypothetical protein
MEILGEIDDKIGFIEKLIKMKIDKYFEAKQKEYNDNIRAQNMTLAFLENSTEMGKNPNSITTSGLPPQSNSTITSPAEVSDQF